MTRPCDACGLYLNARRFPCADCGRMLGPNCREPHRAGRGGQTVWRCRDFNACAVLVLRRTG